MKPYDIPITSKKEEKNEEESEREKNIYDIPEDVKYGTSEMVGYELRNSILRFEELVEKDPNNAEDKKKLADYKMQQEILNTPIINIERHKVINEQNPNEEFSKKQLQEMKKSFLAADMSNLIDEHFVSRFKKTKKEGGTVDDLDEYHSNSAKTGIESLLRAATNLQSRLDNEEKLGANKKLDEANREKHRQQDIDDVRKKIKDINPDEMKEEENKERKIKTPEENRLLSSLNNGNFDVAYNAWEKVSYSDEFFSSEELKEAVDKCFLMCIRRGETENALKVENQFGITDKFIESKEVRKAVIEGITQYLKYGNFKKVDNLMNFGCLLDESDYNELKKPIIDRIIFDINSNQIDNITKVKERFGLTDSFLTDSEIKNAVAKKIILLLEKGEIYEVHEMTGELNFIISESGIKKETIEKANTKGVITLLEKKSFNTEDCGKTIYIAISSLDYGVDFLKRHEFDLPAKKAFDLCIKNNDIKTAQKIKEHYNISEED